MVKSVTRFAKMKVADYITLTGRRNLSLLSLKADMSFANDIPGF